MLVCSASASQNLQNLLDIQIDPALREVMRVSGPAHFQAIADVSSQTLSPVECRPPIPKTPSRQSRGPEVHRRILATFQEVGKGKYHIDNKDLPALADLLRKASTESSALRATPKFESEMTDIWSSPAFTKLYWGALPAEIGEQITRNSLEQNEKLAEKLLYWNAFTYSDEPTASEEREAFFDVKKSLSHGVNQDVCFLTDLLRATQWQLNPVLKRLFDYWSLLYAYLISN